MVREERREVSTFEELQGILATLEDPNAEITGEARGPASRARPRQSSTRSNPRRSKVRRHQRREKTVREEG